MSVKRPLPDFPEPDSRPRGSGLLLAGRERLSASGAARRETPQGNELKAPFGELVITGCGQIARSHGDFDALLVGTEVGMLVDKPRKRWQRFKIVISSMARRRAAAKPLP